MTVRTDIVLDGVRLSYLDFGGTGTPSSSWGTTAHAPALLRQTFAEASELVLRYCGGTAEVGARASEA